MKPLARMMGHAKIRFLPCVEQTNYGCSRILSLFSMIGSI